MTMCKAGIIPNSSFSWWGAYLMNERFGSAPRYWYGGDSEWSHPGINPFSVILDV